MSRPKRPVGDLTKFEDSSIDPKRIVVYVVIDVFERELLKAGIVTPAMLSSLTMTFINENFVRADQVFSFRQRVRFLQSDCNRQMRSSEYVRLPYVTPEFSAFYSFIQTKFLCFLRYSVRLLLELLKVVLLLLQFILCRVLIATDPLFC